MKRIGWIVLALSLFVASAASAQVVPTPTTITQEDARTVQMLLLGYHDLAPKASFDEVPNAAVIVDRLARTSQGVVRDRALAALGRYWPSADVYTLYLDTVASSDTPVGTRYRTVLLLAQTFGDRAIGALQPLLHADDLQLRITAVQALGAIGSDASYALLVEYAKTVDNPTLLAQIDQSARVLR